MDLSAALLLTIAVLFVIVSALAWLLLRSLGGLRDTLAELRSQTVALSQLALREEGADKATEALRLQACERLTLMTERIAVPNLLLRLPPEPGTSGRAYTARLLLTIREEFEYNVTQQVYVSDSLWNVLLQARDNVSQLITRAAEDARDGGQVANRLRVMSAGQPTDPIALAQSAIRREATQILL